MGNQDKGYKLLFSNREIVRDLLTEFVDPEIVKELDLRLDSMIRENSSFVTDDLRERIDDVIWRVGFRGRTLYLCIIIEFQSSEDHWMAARLLAYIGLLYNDIVKRGLLVEDMLPPVLPIVLHSGTRRWKAPSSLEALLAPVSSVLSRYTPTLSYLLLDAGAYDDERLADPQNLAAFLFRMERASMPPQLLEEIRALGRVLREEESVHLRRAFAVFIRNVLLSKKTGRSEFPEVSDLVEVERMIVEGQHEWAENWLKEGEQRGEQRGEQQAKMEMALEMLKAAEPVEKILRYTKITREQLEELRH